MLGGSKTARSLAAAPDANLASLESRRRVAFDPALWQPLSAGEYVNIQTGEIRESDRFDFEAMPASADSVVFSADAWEGSRTSSGGAGARPGRAV